MFKFKPASNITDKTKLIWRIVLGSGFFIAGLNFSNSLFFSEHPLFGVPFLAEGIISLIAGLFGFYLVPTYFLSIKDWAEELIVNTTYSLVSDFWTQYLTRLELARSNRKKEQKKKEVLKAREQLAGGVLLDTSVLIDGRLIDVAKCGFLPQPLILPKFVISELQLLADNQDETKRKKGRRGLDMINELKKHTKIIVYAQKTVSGDQLKVDDLLLQLAKAAKLKLMTLDYNLNKVAQVSNIKVLNLNDLISALRPAFVPGEQFLVKISQIGKEKKQGLGYLDDGTMLVVGNAADKVGQEVLVQVTKLLQSPAGKMVFCELVEQPGLAEA